ncbi:Kelch repeat protein [Aspergillus homomorphus CBS 101889]|uniref:Galactose oxidase n=1 Tax=Aspergillus homomorphus (strain CBS 101889) TaxID=1450537 RepID=A0A395HRT2_ASPHC|nr:galactose oxidase [Aspergillus homomorphus CBS 101889]RAL10661.1 galactose oxidase [Aspergillus homomorphus CBS 101889]
MVLAVWTKLLSDTSLKRSSQTLTVLGNNAYIYGGELRPREPVDSTVYHLALNPTTPANPTIAAATAIASPSTTPQPRVGSASTTLAGKIYIFSGRGGIALEPIEESGAFWVFDPTNNTWTQLCPANPESPFPAGRSYHTLTNNGTDTIYLHAGCPPTGRLRDLWAFDIATRQWRECAPAPPPERGGASIAYAEGKVYRMNGFDGTREQGGAMDVYDPVADAWSTVSYSADGMSGPTPRSVGCLLAVKVAGRPCLVTVFGEHDPSSLGHQGAGKMLGDMWVFDIELQRWAQVEVEGESPAPRGWFDADVVVSGEGRSSIVVHGGLSESNERLDDVWRLEF